MVGGRTAVDRQAVTHGVGLDAPRALVPSFPVSRCRSSSAGAYHIPVRAGRLEALSGRGGRAPVTEEVAERAAAICDPPLPTISRTAGVWRRRVPAHG